jgi:CIC family chloride channel protein
MRHRTLTKFLDRLTQRQGLVLVVLALLIGAGTGLAAVCFIRLIALTHTFSYTNAGDLAPQLGRVWFIIIPVAGGLLGGPIIAYFAHEAKGHGVPEVMQALILEGGRIRPRVALAKIVASALCIGSGGSAGREGPIVQVGSTLGSTLGQWLGLSDERIKNMVACGAAAGIAATFNAPIAGVAFATEVLMSELQVTVFGNVVIAAVAASTVSQIFLGAQPAFQVPTYQLNSLWEIPLYGVLGVLAALVGVFFIKLLTAIENIFDRWRFPMALKPAVGALLLGVLAFGYPHLSGLVSIYHQDTRLGMPLIANVPHVFGSGFSFMDEVLQGKSSFMLLLILIFLKPLATSFTLGSGNSGGVFAPALFTGAMLGGAFGFICKHLFPQLPIAVGAFSLVGMAAVFAAAARAPLTSILIVFEMSNDYHLILPLMAAGMVASSLAQWLYPDSIYTEKLTKKGIRLEHGRDLDVLQGVQVEEVMNHSPVTVHRGQSAAELFAAFQETHLHGFPVMSSDEDLYGIVTLQDMERAIQKEGVNLRELKVEQVATVDPVTVFPDEAVWNAIRKMSPRDLSRLPVVSRHNHAKLVGLISHSDIMKAYNIGLMHKQQVQYDLDQLTLRRVTGVKFLEISVGTGCDTTGKTLADIHLPAGTNVVSIQRAGMVVVPSGGTQIMPGDLLTILCMEDNMDQVRAIFNQGCRYL